MSRQKQIAAVAILGLAVIVVALVPLQFNISVPGLAAGQGPSFDYSSFVGEPVYLYLEAMASLPNDVIFLGGSYRTGADPIHNSLLVSRDRGKTWMETGPRVEGSSIGRLQTHGKQKVWALVQQSAEGTSAPHALLISSDAGRSWDLVSLSSLGFQTGLEDPDIFHFFDADHGLLSVKPPSGKGKVWQTSDGGRSWHLVWETRVDPDFDGPFLYPRDPDPLHATLFTTMQYGYDKATSLVRLWEDPVRPFDPYVIQRFTDVSRERTDERNWEKVGTIPRNYIVRNGRLQPD